MEAGQAPPYCTCIDGGTGSYAWAKHYSHDYMPSMKSWGPQIGCGTYCIDVGRIVVVLQVRPPVYDWALSCVPPAR
jgi:hypothetical protein